ncbi:MAG: chemotaxis protein CheW [Vicinamibacterales bacterium]
MQAALDSSVLFRLGSQLYAFSAVSVSEMVPLTNIHAVPDRAPYIRGLINLRGSVLPVLDLRLRLGLPSALEELEALIAVFDAREQDHRNWIQELDASIRERRPFTLTTDPTACAFGRWYATLRSDNIVLQTHLRRIDVPHREVHSRGAEALALEKAGNFEAASAIAKDIREHSLKRTLAAMDDAKAGLRDAHREIAIVVQGPAGRLAVVVDAVEAVEALRERHEEDDQQAVLSSTEPDLTSIRRRMKDDSLVVEVDVWQLTRQELGRRPDGAVMPPPAHPAASAIAVDF